MELVSSLKILDNRLVLNECVCVSVCVCVFIKLYITAQSGPVTVVFSMPLALILPRGDVFSFHLFGTSSSLDIPAGVTQEEGHTGFLIHVPSEVHAFIFLARRIRPFLSLADREVEFCVCVCVCFLTNLFGTSSSLDVSAGVTQEEGHT